MARLAERVQHKRILVLIRRMLKAKVIMPGGVAVNTEERGSARNSNQAAADQHFSAPSISISG